LKAKLFSTSTLGLQITEVSAHKVAARIEMKPEFVGHFAHNRVHGGVISASLDSIGGFGVMAAIGARHRDEPVAKRIERFGKLGTIDLRVDYLRPP
jgi:acyl-coenzyme A thioesterase PaaI-like protein